MIAVTDYTPEDLLDTAKGLLSRPDANAKGIWPRAAAHLGRQSPRSLIGAVVDEATSRHGDHLHARPSSCVFRPYLTMDGLAGRVAYTWSGLSNACHHHVYELAPSLTELAAWLDITMELAHAVKMSERG